MISFTRTSQFPRTWKSSKTRTHILHRPPCCSYISLTFRKPTLAAGSVKTELELSLGTNRGEPLIEAPDVRFFQFTLGAPASNKRAQIPRMQSTPTSRSAPNCDIALDPLGFFQQLGSVTMRQLSPSRYKDGAGFSQGHTHQFSNSPLPGCGSAMSHTPTAEPPSSQKDHSQASNWCLANNDLEPLAPTPPCSYQHQEVTLHFEKREYGVW